jgi:hypothetical protein
MNWGPIQAGAFEALIFSGNKKGIKSKKGTGHFFYYADLINQITLKYMKK